MLAHITENETIKSGLFPGPGANVSTVKGGGPPKTKHQFKLFELTFGNQLKWQDELEIARDKSGGREASKVCKSLGSKIKNRLSKMAKLTCQITEALGETGEGIEAVNEIDMSKENHFMNVWNLGVLEALSSNYDNGTVGDTSKGDADINTNAEQSTTAATEEKLSDIDNDKDTLKFWPQNPHVLSKAKTAPQPGASKAVKLEEKKSQHRTKMDEFAEIAKEEEKMAQKEFELAKLKAELEITCTKGSTEVKLEKEKRKAEEFRLKLEAKERDKKVILICSQELLPPVRVLYLQAYGMDSDMTEGTTHDQYQMYNQMC
ncbi:hypothetical protein GYMLUDRAFT_65011 [Collybiopsis luxurians FD-317 M1]|uniref:No apical meristem-associated C-terminal domain-containing protein n=1 Tax=Collybiopsis luxurians FD-317 M1 TaxID=944289 RepID=A0A0D0C0I6_9AGAR|nr:hypothetical protein GYMLUDRAFT_65011 [Collybiopsis luxurians FD-317 M1]